LIISKVHASLPFDKLENKDNGWQIELPEASRGTTIKTSQSSFPIMPPPAPRFCTVCDMPVGMRKFLCLRCKAIVGNRFDRLLFRIALRNSYDKSIDRFRCRYSGAILEEAGDPFSPWHITADHVVPGQRELAIAAYLINDMKSGLTADEFLTVVPALDDHFLGIRPFDRDIIEFSAWNNIAEFKPAPKRLARRERSRIPVTACTICGRMPLKGSIYCGICRNIIYQRWEIAARAAALKRAWDPKRQAFICYYTGAVLEIKDPNSPWFIVFDHLTPAKKNDVEACAFWVNAMKTCLTETEFGAVIHSFSEHIRHGTPFDKSLMDDSRFRRAARRVA
jgi:hypothetical protein